MMAFGKVFQMGDRILATHHWQIVGKFFMPCGNTHQWYRCMGALQLIDGTENAKRGHHEGEVEY